MRTGHSAQPRAGCQARGDQKASTRESYRVSVVGNVGPVKRALPQRASETYRNHGLLCHPGGGALTWGWREA